MTKTFHFIGFLLFTWLSVSVQAQKQTKIQDNDKAPDAKGLKLLIDSLSNALNRWYIYPDKAAMMENTVKKNYKSGAYNTTENRDDLIAVINKDIQQAHKDKHLRLRYNPEFAKEIAAQLTDAQKKEIFKESITEARDNNFGLAKVEIFPCKIGYIRWDAFYDIAFMEESKPLFDGAFHLVKNCNALIIDMRYNGGGQPEMVHYTQSYFFNQKTHMNDIVDRNSDTVLKAWADPTKTDIKLNMPVYILTGRYTFSGGEDFVFGLQKAKRATVVGDTTGGGAHPTDMFNLGQGFLVSIPIHRSSNVFAKTDWEGTGIYPDVPVTEGAALSKAKSMIYTAMMEKATDTDERNLYRWFVYATENKELLIKQQRTDSVYYSNEQLKQFCGEYHNKKLNTSVAIFLKGNSLYIDFLSTKDPDIRLIAVGNNRFSYNEDIGRALDFVIDNSGKVVGITNIRTNGINEFEKVK